MPREMTIISGKGGCGKTTIAASLVALAEDPVIADADVDAADMHILLQPEVRRTEEFSGLDVARKDDAKCTECRLCLDNCRFGAIDADLTLHQDRCEGCAVCELVCPAGAITMVEKNAGEAYVSDTRFGPMVHAKLHAGEEASGKLVALVRQRAREVAEASKKDLIIIDGPPGTGCTVIAAITGADMVLVVFEPTLSGIHDAKRIIEVARHFKVPILACINKHDINEQNTDQIMRFCDSEGISVVGRIAYDDSATRAMVAGITVPEYSNGMISESLQNIWEKVREALDGH
ncbi:MAG: (4Fe-4S)-binding protein [Candidatus Proteinoplasmatales archaeon SG8-5]|nr:MAG: (4Fe-4S)-binding protein [Candidatus Proteinoplasmatales archaeon SG8-5]